VRESLTVSYAIPICLLLYHIGIKVVRSRTSYNIFRWHKVSSLTGFRPDNHRATHHNLGVGIIATRTWKECLLLLVIFQLSVHGLFPTFYSSRWRRVVSGFWIVISIMCWGSDGVSKISISFYKKLLLMDNLLVVGTGSGFE